MPLLKRPLTLLTVWALLMTGTLHASTAMPLLMWVEECPF